MSTIYLSFRDVIYSRAAGLGSGIDVAYPFLEVGLAVGRRGGDGIPKDRFPIFEIVKKGDLISLKKVSASHRFLNCVRYSSGFVIGSLGKIKSYTVLQILGVEFEKPDHLEFSMHFGSSEP